MKKRVNMILTSEEEMKLSSIKRRYGLKTTTDTIRYLISSNYIKISETKSPTVPWVSPNSFITPPNTNPGASVTLW